MNVLVLIKKLDETPLEREVRAGGTHGEIITFYNETDNNYCLVMDTVEYNDVVQVCIIFKDNEYYAYIQHGENSNFVRLDVDSIMEIDCFNSI